jgi:hypothetical protein
VEFASELLPLVPRFRRSGRSRFDVSHKCAKICQPHAVQPSKGNIVPSVSLGRGLNRWCLNKRWL